MGPRGARLQTGIADRFEVGRLAVRPAVRAVRTAIGVEGGAVRLPPDLLERTDRGLATRPALEVGLMGSLSEPLVRKDAGIPLAHLLHLLLSRPCPRDRPTRTTLGSCPSTVVRATSISLDRRSASDQQVALVPSFGCCRGTSRRKPTRRSGPPVCPTGGPMRSSLYHTYADRTVPHGR